MGSRDGLVLALDKSSFAEKGLPQGYSVELILRGVLVDREREAGCRLLSGCSSLNSIGRSV